jgi:hypothetical protein
MRLPRPDKSGLAKTKSEGLRMTAFVKAICKTCTLECRFEGKEAYEIGTLNCLP